MSQNLILCEGYDDRAFWKGWLLSLGALDLLQEAGFDRTRLRNTLLGANIRSNDGDFCLRSPGGTYFVVRPCLGQTSIWTKAQVALNDRLVDRVILNCDSDRPASDPEPIQHRLQRLRQLNSEIPIDLVVWHCDDPPGLPGVPEQQTLERLICAAIASAQPETWKQAVEEFLRHEPVLGPNHKNYAHAYWAKFFAHDFDDIYQAVWSRERFAEVAAQLEARLRRNGDWERIAELVAG